MSLPQLSTGLTFAGDYRVLGMLSDKGGMGAVYLVEQLSTGKKRALKIMRPEVIQHESLREKFKAEATISGKIDSEHVVEVVAAGIDDQTPWLVMELLEGTGLDDAIEQRGSLPPAEVGHILTEVCDALQAAHAAGIIHCDLKPENIFLARIKGKQQQRVKVLDFGIARLLEGDRTAVTLTSAVGSPHFMAPEQGRKGHHVRAQTDLWALGLIAFKMLTGKHYWRAANVSKDNYDFMQLIAEVATGELVTASVRARELGCRVTLPEGFDAWFSRCVNRDPALRHGSATDALEGLQRALQATEAIAATRSLSSAPLEPYPTRWGTERPSVTPESQGTQLLAQGPGGTLMEVTSPLTSTRTIPTTAPRRGFLIAAISAMVGLPALVFGVWTLAHSEGTEPPRQPDHNGALARRPAVPNVPSEHTSMAAPTEPSLASRVEATNPWVSLTTLGIDLQTYEVSVAEWNLVHRLPGGSATEPMTRVSWEDARDFCENLGHGARLPHRAEWRAIFGQPSLPSHSLSAPPSRGNPNDLSLNGVYDLMGNVREWTDEALDADGQRTALGGAAGDSPRDLRSYLQDGEPKPGPDHLVGLRCLRSRAP